MKEREAEAGKKLAIAICILLERSIRYKFEWHESIPDWWNVSEADWSEYYRFEYNEREKLRVCEAFPFRLEALVCFMNYTNELLIDPTDSIIDEIGYEKDKMIRKSENSVAGKAKLLLAS
ncbi:hypothetical protein LEP1GSC058_0933 [Leptospira fainei serovar Hurstbridge str. BUT 6]|uniref:Uncharacterized protein n=1 Tax=Leptospira fainei serovar Hurstbridge str. BUT 6 TaxID=1193011 RepID=S3UWR1_9LEPT|nr:hypothetical protein [Leptospira fainei]EPG72799.1 hypothetical protein LEP1GSC058_0933 [Leptospira fainei serovar Hurstbridge str. BUT 6]